MKILGGIFRGQITCRLQSPSHQKLEISGPGQARCPLILWRGGEASRKGTVTTLTVPLWLVSCPRASGPGSTFPAASSNAILKALGKGTCFNKDKQKLTSYYNGTLWKMNFPTRASWCKSLHMQILTSSMRLARFSYIPIFIFIYGAITLKSTHTNKNCGRMSP